MKRHFDDLQKRMEPELIASFGGAQIVKYLDGKLEIRGGTELEKTQAHEWLKQFWQKGPLTVRRVG